MYSLTSLSWRRKSFLSKQMIVREVDILVIFSIAAIVVSETATVLRVRQQRPPVCARSVGLQCVLLVSSHVFRHDVTKHQVL